MRLPLKWIAEHVAVQADAAEIADRLTMCGFEVEETQPSPIGPVLDIKVTPNRGDGLSVVGVARELAAAYNVPLTNLPAASTSVAGDAAGRVRVDILDPDLCPRYAARVVGNIHVGPSPGWMQARLSAAGMRPVNNIVDVTNYVMLLTGQPLHAFDYDTLHDRRIVVRRARAGERIATLDGQDRALTTDMLVIADADRPVAIAGVMGGAETEMTDATRTMLLESAHFDPRSVRRTSRDLELRTEASYRFERVVDPKGVAAAADLACRLIADLGAGEPVTGIVDVYPKPAARRVVVVRPERASLLLGYRVCAADVVDSLTRLGFVHEAADSGDSKSGLRFLVPSWRTDIEREVDAIEDVGRVLGYERIPERLPSGATTQGGNTTVAMFLSEARDLLAGAGLQEAVCFSMLAPSPLDDAAADGERIPIRSALSSELAGLRRSLIPGLVDVLDRNARRGQLPLAFYEIGRVFRACGDEHAEVVSVAGALAGALFPVGWQRHARSSSADFFTVCGLVERLAGGLHVPGLSFGPAESTLLHPGRGASVLIGGTVTGLVGELHPDLASGLNVRDRIVVFELTAETLRAARAAGPGFVPPQDQPAVVRDLAPRVSTDVKYADVRGAVEAAAVDLLESFSLTDVFVGPPLPAELKSLTLSFVFRAPGRTLVDEEVSDALSKIRAEIGARCGATFAG